MLERQDPSLWFRLSVWGNDQLNYGVHIYAASLSQAPLALGLHCSIWSVSNLELLARKSHSYSIYSLPSGGKTALAVRTQAVHLGIPVEDPLPTSTGRVVRKEWCSSDSQVRYPNLQLSITWELLGNAN